MKALGHERRQVYLEKRKYVPSSPLMAGKLQMVHTSAQPRPARVI
jgi:hypothetical protein